MQVGILGLAGSGKDTFAKMLQEELATLGHNFSLESYAKPLKVLTSTIFNLTLDELEDRALKETPKEIDPDYAIQAVFNLLNKTLQFTPEELETASEKYFEVLGNKTNLSPREFQQLFGTDVVRATKSTAWVDYLQAKKGNLIVTDVRFENELCGYDYIVQRFKGTTRPLHTSEQFAWDLQNDEDTRFLYDIPQVINYESDWTLADLQYQAKQYAKFLSEELTVQY